MAPCSTLCEDTLALRWRSVYQPEHCHGAVLELLMYKYWASFSLSSGTIGRVGSYESLALLSMDGA